MKPTKESLEKEFYQLENIKEWEIEQAWQELLAAQQRTWQIFNARKLQIQRARDVAIGDLYKRAVRFGIIEEGQDFPWHWPKWACRDCSWIGYAENVPCPSCGSLLLRRMAEE